MTPDLHAVAAADLAGLLAVVERWAGLVPTDEPSTVTVGTDPAPTIGRHDVTSSTASSTPSPSPSPSSPSSRPSSGEARSSPALAPSDGRGTEQAPAVAPPTAAPATAHPAAAPPGTSPVAARSESSGAPTHWSGRLPSRRPAWHDLDRDLLHLAERHIPQTSSLDATMRATAAAPLPATSVRRVVPTAPTDVDWSRSADPAVPMPPIVRPASPSPPNRHEPALSGTRAFPTPVLAGDTDGVGTPAPPRADHGSVPRPPDSAARSMIAARTSRHPSSAATEGRIADLLALDRLGEAMADAIEAALIDAGVDVS